MWTRTQDVTGEFTLKACDFWESGAVVASPDIILGAVCGSMNVSTKFGLERLERSRAKGTHINSVLNPAGSLVVTNLANDWRARKTLIWQVVGDQYLVPSKCTYLPATSTVQFQGDVLVQMKPSAGASHCFPDCMYLIR
jgi:hypothetical protein